jgi:tRNA dimethylallyltransferase
VNSGKSPIRIILIVGPTGVGKTELAIELAEIYHGEIISADSMQVYRYMDIGTAKPKAEEKRRVRHHLIDVVNPDESFNVAIYLEKASEIIDRLEKAGKTIFVVGGTGLYIKALLGGLFPGPGADNRLRVLYRAYQQRHGTIYLYRLLEEKDERAAEKIHPNDAARIIRALEFFERTGESITHKQEEHNFCDRRYNSIAIGLNIDRNLLYNKINSRADRMLSDGLIDEVEMLIKMGYDESVRPMQAMHYRYITDYIKGRREKEAAVRLLKRDTRRYAKRQLTWFGRDNEIAWFIPQDFNLIKSKIDVFLV